MDVQDKCERKLDILNKREFERQLDIQKTLDDKTLTKAANEKIDYFQHEFHEKEQEINEALTNSKSIDKKLLPEHFNVINNNIILLQKHVAASNIFLRTYDIKIYQKNIQDMLNIAKDLESELLPKKKFGFKNKQKDEQKEYKINSLTKITRKYDEIDAPVLEELYCGFKNESNQTLIISNEKTLKKDVSLSNLNGCIVKIFGNPSTLHMSELINCKIFSGPVSTSIFAENCKDCIFVISCQQLRLHSSKDTDIYLHVTSRAIMEDCNQIYFAPYNYSYDTIDDDYVLSGLDRSINNWDIADDFNWLNIEKKSPHWHILDESIRVVDWNPTLNA